jgi:hypothetical protein
MDLITLLDKLRSEYPGMSATALVGTGGAGGWIVAWFLLRHQITTYKTKLEHLQEVLDGKLSASTYKPIRFRKERPVLAGIAIAILGVMIVAIGLVFIVANFKRVSPAAATQEALKSSTEVKDDPGPLIWFVNLTMEGGPLQERNVFSLQFRGMNKSDKEVKLKSAKMVSTVDGTELSLEVVADNEVVTVDQIGLIPPGAPITLVGKFGAPDPSAPGKILGIEGKAFLEKWRQFSLNVEDDTRTYRVPFTEPMIAPFFPNMIGPHVSRKS